MIVLLTDRVSDVSLALQHQGLQRQGTISLVHTGNTPFDPVPV